MRPPSPAGLRRGLAAEALLSCPCCSPDLLAKEDLTWSPPGAQQSRLVTFPVAVLLARTLVIVFLALGERHLDFGPSLFVEVQLQRGERAPFPLDGGRVLPRPGNVGPPVAPETTTVAVEFNDPEAVAEALAGGEVALTS